MSHLSKMNGWQRLWFVLAVVSFVVSTIIFLNARSATVAIEDEAIVSEINSQYDRQFEIREAQKDSKSTHSLASGFQEVPLSLSEIPTINESRCDSPSAVPESLSSVDERQLLLLRAKARATFFRTKQAEQPFDPSSATLVESSNYPTHSKLDTITFPNYMRYAEIKEFIYRFYSKGADSLHILASHLIEERNKLQVADARHLNNEVRRSNIQIALYCYVGWLILATSLYLLGFGIGWIYRGFKNT